MKMIIMKKIKYLSIIFILLLFFIPSNAKTATNDKTYLWIDYPKTSQINQTEMEVNGWVMSTYSNKKVKIYVDGKQRQEKIETRARGDVHAAIKGYGTIKENPEPGFKSILNLKD